MILRAGSSPGDRANVVHAKGPGVFHRPNPCIPKDGREGSLANPAVGYLPMVSFLRGGAIPKEAPFDQVRPPIRVPSGEGKRRKADRPSETDPCRKRPRTFRHGPVDPRSHPITRGKFPREILSGSWVEPWRMVSFQDTFPEGRVSIRDTGLQGSDPHGGTCLPFCRGMGGTFTP